MSANLDFVRSIYARWELGDWGANDWADPQIEFVIADGPDRRITTGVESMARVWREFLGAWTGYAISADEYRELDGERVLVLLRARGWGKASGVEIGTERGANIFDVRDSAVTRLTIYFDYRRALADLGLAD